MDGHDVKLTRSTLPLSECTEPVEAVAQRRQVQEYTRRALSCHPARAAVGGGWPSNSAAFVREARIWDRSGEADENKDPDVAVQEALTTFAHAVLLRLHTEALGSRCTPARALMLLNKLALPPHGVLAGGAASGQARAALATLVLQPSHVWNVLEHLPQEQRVEFHYQVLVAARAMEAMWQPSA